MGAYATALPGGVPVDAEHAAALGERVGVRGAGRARVAPRRRWCTRRRPATSTCCGRRAATSSRSCPTRRRWRPPSTGCPCRVHQDVVVTSQMLAEGDDVILLPVATRYEQEGGGTVDHHRAPHHLQPGDPSPGGRGPQRVATVRRRRRAGAARARRRLRVADQPGPARGDRAGGARRTPASRRCAPPATRCSGAVGTCAPTGDFPLPDGRGRFTAAGARRSRSCPTGTFTVATRRGKQFNSMVHAEVDPLTGAGRDAVYIDEADARALGAGDGAPVRLRSEAGSFDGHLKVVRLPARSLQVHWPEGNVLIAGGPATRSRGRRCPTTTRSSPSRCCRPTATVSLAPMPEPLAPAVGWGVLHLFCHGRSARRRATPWPPR